MGVDTNKRGQGMGVEVKTNGHQRQFICRYDVPDKILKDQFSHITEDDGFFCFLKYKGRWDHTKDFPRFGGYGQPFRDVHHAFGGSWDGYAGTGLSGVLIKISDDQDTYSIATCSYHHEFRNRT